MADEHTPLPARRARRLDPASLAGLLLLFVVALATGCSFVTSQEASGEAATAVATQTPAEILAGSIATPTLHPAVPTATDAPLPTNTALPTSTTTVAATLTATPGTPTATFTPTEPPPLPTPSGVYSWTLQVPILMYHYISVPPADADIYRTDLSVAPENFRAQLQYLADSGYQTVDLYDLTLAITAKRDLPPKPVIITMDDGYRDNYDNAFPLLKEFGMQATFFVVTQFIDEGREDYMTWDMVKEMAAAGMRIEPHSKTHPDLSGQPYDYVLYEILSAQQTIAAQIGYTPRYFCFPGGRYDATTIQVLQDMDMWGAVTTQGGMYHGFDNRYEWSRLRMRYTTGMGEFAQMVDAGEFVAGKPPGAEQ